MPIRAVSARPIGSFAAMVFDDVPAFAVPAGSFACADLRRVGVDATGGNQIAAVACHDVQIGCGLADVEMVGIKLANGFCPLDVLGHFFTFLTV